MSTGPGGGVGASGSAAAASMPASGAGAGGSGGGWYVLPGATIVTVTRRSVGMYIADTSAPTFSGAGFWFCVSLRISAAFTMPFDQSTSAN